MRLDMQKIAALLGVTLLLSGCASTPERPVLSRYDPQALQFQMDKAESRSEVDFGAYVSAQFAGASNDPAAADFFLRALEQDPTNAIMRDRAFGLLVLEGRYKEAVKVAKTLWDSERANNLVRMALALDAFKQDDIERSQIYLAATSRSGFEALLVPIVEAWVFAEAGDKTAALAALDPLGTSLSLKSFQLPHKAFILDYLGDKEAADRAYQDVLASGQLRSLNPIIAYGAFLLANDRKQEAVELYDSYDKVFPNNDFLTYHQDQLLAGKTRRPVFTRNSRAGAALAFHRAASELAREKATRPAIYYARMATMLDPKLDEGWIVLGNLLAEEERYDASLSAYAMVRSEGPLAALAVFQRANTLRLADRTDDAISVLQTFLVKNPRNVQAAQWLGDTYRIAGDFANAARTYDLAVAAIEETTASHWFLYFTRGIAYERLGHWDLAEPDMLKALELNPDDPQVLNYLGYTWIDRGINLEKGTRMIKQAVDQRPNDGAIVDSLGWAYYLQGNYERAVELLQRAVGMEPSDPVINDHLGDAYWQVGRRIEARFQWKHALANDPEDRDRIKIEDKLDLGLTVASRDQ